MEPITDPRRLLGPKPKRAKVPRFRPSQELAAERRDLSLSLFLTSNASLRAIGQTVAAILNDRHKADKDWTAITVDEQDVRRDLKWWKTEYGKEWAEKLDVKAGATVGEALDFYQRMEREAVDNYMQGKQWRGGNQARGIPPTPPLRQRELGMWQRLAVKYRELRLNLMMDLGLLERHLGTIDTKGHVTAEQVHQAMERAKQQPAVISTPYTRKWLGDAPTDGAKH